MNNECIIHWDNKEEYQNNSFHLFKIQFTLIVMYCMLSCMGSKRNIKNTAPRCFENITH